MVRGIAMRITSSGILTIYSPLRENMTRMVNSNATRVSGLILGTNFVWYHSLVFMRIRMKLELFYRFYELNGAIIKTFTSRLFRA
jgi:hypothetical protein